MRLKVTFARSNGRNDDIAITTDASASISDVARALADVDPSPELIFPAETKLTLRAVQTGDSSWAMLPPDAPIGEDWLGSGASVALAEARRDTTDRSSALAVLQVLSGPDAGSEYPLPWGSTIVGRGSDADIRLGDRLVSKRHIRLEVTDVVEVVDLGSANGVVVDGGLVTRLRVDHQETFLIGESYVRVHLVEKPRQAAATPAPTKSGSVFFNRSPRVERRYSGKEYAAPDVPVEKDDQPFPWLAMVAPILLGLSMAVLFNRPAALLFVLMSPMMLIGNFIMTRKKDARSIAKAVRIFEDRIAVLSTDMARESEVEIATRLGESPSTAEVLTDALDRGPLLWTRRPEHWSFLNVRLGTGTMASRCTIEAAKRGEMIPEFQVRLDALMEHYKDVDGVPLIDNLFESGALGIAGQPDVTVGTLNAVLVQLTGLHSPAELVVSALVTPQWSNELDWIKWLPHSSSPQSPVPGLHLADSASSVNTVLASLEELIAQRLARKKTERRGAMEQDKAALERGSDVGLGTTANGTGSPIPAVVVVISNDVAIDRARLVQLAESGADAGVYPIWVANDVAALPAVCRTYIHLDRADNRADVAFVRIGELISDVVIEQVDRATAMHYARMLAPVIDAGALIADSSDLPKSVAMTTLLGHDVFEQGDAIVDRWRQNESIHDRTPGVEPTPRRAGKLRAIVGSGGIDAMHLDLRAQGPHALVGGTTGAGKSEFLQAWVLGMAAEYSPDRVTFLFVDYKGGSAFADCVTLPHCVGLVTDLSPHLVRRALTSLRAELHHREHLFNRKKAKDLIELEKRGDPEAPPALVLVIDEFAALAGEVPAFVDGVVDIAQRGRSLGIHLIMATQRPAGVIKDNLRANTNLRVALRMADESDSVDVIGIKDSAHFDPGLPGRGIAKTGPGRLQLFQSGYAGGWTSRVAEKADVSVGELRFGGEVPWQSRVGDAAVEEERDLGPSDQQRLVSTITAANAMARNPAPRRPWLDELPVLCDLSKHSSRNDAELIIGLSDVPTEQRQAAVFFRPDVDGHIGIYGTGGSGKSVTLRTLATAAADTPLGGPTAVYALDFGAGGLRMLEGLPNVGSVIVPDDTERIIRLLRTLRAELESRAQRFAEVNASSIVQYRELANRPDEQRILLLIDGFPSFREDWELTLGRAVWYDVFKDILAGGRQLGMHIAFTADRYGAVPSSVSASVQRRVVLRLSDETAYTMLDVPKDILSEKSAPGRAIVDGLETQIAVLGSSSPTTSTSSDQAVAITELAASLAGRTHTVEPIRSLPKEYPASDLPDAVGNGPALGIGDDTLGPVGFDPTGTLLLSGPPVSGRSTALRTLTASIRRFDPTARTYYIGNARSGFAGEKGWTATATTVDEAAALAKELSAMVQDATQTQKIVVIIETIIDFLQTPADAPLVDLIKQVKRSDHFLLAESETASWNGSWPLLGEIKNARRGFLLQPDPMEGDLLLKTPLPRAARSEFPPGRGMLVAKGKTQRVQLPLEG